MDSSIFKPLEMPYYGIILDKLELKNVYNCTLINKKYAERVWNYIIKRIIKNIENRLKDIFGDKYLEFKKVMYETKSVISGSILIQCILEEKWEGSDIDIYTSKLFKYHKKEDDGKCHYSVEYSNLSNFLYKASETINKNNNEVSHNAHMCRSGRNCTFHGGEADKWENKSKNEVNLNDCIYYRINEVEFQAIELYLNDKKLDIKDIKDFIWKKFDFNICKNILYYDENYDCKIITNNIKNIFKREIEIDHINWKSLNRVYKYRDRYFHFTCTNMFDKIKECIDNDFFHVWEMKYKGFLGHKPPDIYYELYYVSKFVESKDKTHYELKKMIKNNNGNLPIYKYGSNLSLRYNNHIYIDNMRECYIKKCPLRVIGNIYHKHVRGVTEAPHHNKGEYSNKRAEALIIFE